MMPAVPRSYAPLQTDDDRTAAAAAAAAAAHHPSSASAVAVATSLVLLSASSASSSKRSWTVPHHLQSADPDVYAVGLRFVQRTFGLCVVCFGITVCVTHVCVTVPAACGGAARR